MKFYMTFGSGQPNAHCVLPLLADNEQQARAYMWETYNGHWCGTYTEEQWNDWKAKKPWYIPLERELHAIDIRKEFSA